MKNRQKGVSPVGVLIFGAFFGFVLLLAFRTVPAVTEYFAIQRIIRLVAAEGEAGAPVAELRRSFDRRSQIDDVASVSGTDLGIAKQGGKVMIDVEYERRVPVAGNVSLVIEFRATSADQ